MKILNIKIVYLSILCFSNTILKEIHNPFKKYLSCILFLLNFNKRMIKSNFSLPKNEKNIISAHVNSKLENEAIS